MQFLFICHSRDNLLIVLYCCQVRAPQQSSYTKMPQHMVLLNPRLLFSLWRRRGVQAASPFASPRRGQLPPTATRARDVRSQTLTGWRPLIPTAQVQTDQTQSTPQDETEGQSPRVHGMQNQQQSPPSGKGTGVMVTSERKVIPLCGKKGNYRYKASMSC